MGLLQVRTGCRLHFGLLELAAEQPHRFGGLGLMLETPDLLLEFPDDAIALPPIRPDSDALELHRRLAQAIETKRSVDTTDAPCPQVRAARILPLHHGLGSGTQLACAAAVGVELHAALRATKRSKTISNFLESEAWNPVHELLPDLTPQRLASWTGRGLRSAVGLHGFLHGGLILDAGQNLAQENTSAARPVETRGLTMPADWRVALVIPEEHSTVSGTQEAAWIDELGKRANPHRERMIELSQAMLAAVAANLPLNEFTDALDQYMRYTAQLFSARQQGMYNGPAVVDAVAACKAVGLRGVGQSSWGPTVFGFACDAAAAESMVKRLRELCRTARVHLSVPAAAGATVRWQVDHA